VLTRARARAARTLRACRATLRGTLFGAKASPAATPGRPAAPDRTPHCEEEALGVNGSLGAAQPQNHAGSSRPCAQRPKRRAGAEPVPPRGRARPHAKPPRESRAEVWARLNARLAPGPERCWWHEARSGRLRSDSRKRPGGEKKETQTFCPTVWARGLGEAQAQGKRGAQRHTGSAARGAPTPPLLDLTANCQFVLTPVPGSDTVPFSHSRPHQIPAPSSREFLGSLSLAAASLQAGITLLNHQSPPRGKIICFCNSQCKRPLSNFPL